MRSILAAAALAAALTTGAAAQGGLPAPTTGQLAPADSKVITTITPDELEAVIKRGGNTYVRNAVAEGTDNFDITTGEGMKYTLYLADCLEMEKGKCRSVNAISFNFNETPNVTLKRLNEWNRSAWGVRALLHKDGTSGLVMNMSLDGGVTASWIKESCATYDLYLKSFSDMVGGGEIPQ